MADLPATPGRRRKRDRARTESDLLDATQRLFDRDGVLAGLNLNEVATVAHVNRGQIYQMYGSRRALLRAALVRALGRLRQLRSDPNGQSFAERRRALLRFLIDEPQTARTAVLLALDGDETFQSFPGFAVPRDETAHEAGNGSAETADPADVDAAAAHILTTATSLGYALIREAAAHQAHLDLGELDTRILTAYDRMLATLTPDHSH